MFWSTDDYLKIIQNFFFSPFGLSPSLQQMSAPCICLSKSIFLGNCWLAFNLNTKYCSVAMGRTNIPKFSSGGKKGWFWEKQGWFFRTLLSSLTHQPDHRLSAVPLPELKLQLPFCVLQFLLPSHTWKSIFLPFLPHLSSYSQANNWSSSRAETFWLQ